MTVTPTLSPPITLRDAVAAIASACDGAHARDGRDFNDSDTSFARRIAAMPQDAWGAGTERACWEMLGKYRGQLLDEHRINFAAIPEPASAAAPTRQVRSLYARDSSLVITFSFDEQVHTAVRALPERTYDRDSKEWSVPATSANAAALEAFAATFDFHVGRDARALLDALHRGEAAPPARRVEHHPDGWRIVLPRPATPTDFALISAVEALPARFRRAGRGRPAHWTFDETPETLAALCELAATHPDLHVDPAAAGRLTTQTPAPADPATEPAQVTLKGSRFVLRFDYDPRLVAEVKQLPDRRFNAEDKSWSVPGRATSAADLAELIQRHGLSITPIASTRLTEIVAEARARAERRAQLEPVLLRLSQAHDCNLPPMDGFGLTPYPFQRAGIAYAHLARRVLLADSMGLGKTIEALGAIHLNQAFPAIIVCPASHKLTWRDEIEVALPGRRVAILHGRTPDPEALVDAEVIVLNYDILNAWAKLLEKVPYQALVGDEGHKLKEHAKTKNGKLTGPARSHAFQRLARRAHKRDALVLLCTGTPIPNRVRELVNLLRILDCLDEFGGEYGFKQRFCDPAETEHGTTYEGASNLDELNVALRRTCMVRRHKRDVLKDLPAKQRTLVRLRLPDADMRAYDQAKADIVSFLRDHCAERAHQRALAQDLAAAEARVLAHEAGEKAAGAARRAPGLVEINTLRQLVAIAKTPLIVDWTNTFLESGEKLILFAVHRPVQEALLDAFPGCARLVAADPPAVQHEHKRRFQADPECQLIVGSLDVAKEGHTLTAASNVAFAELDWSPLSLEQGEDRAYGRMNDPHGANCWYLLANGTIDFDMAELVEGKRQVASRAMDGAASDRLLGGSILDGLLDRLLEDT